jgi:hypothetical protein
MIGNTPATANLNFSWDQCEIVGAGTTSCTVDDIYGVSVNLDEDWAPAPDFQILNTSWAESFISCGLVFNCTTTSAPGFYQVSAEVAGGSDPVASIDDTVGVEGTGCPTEGQWVAQYEITSPSGGLESDN